MQRIAIVDDEPAVIDEIQCIITGFFQEQNKSIDISCFSSGEEIISYHQQYDLIFLDIQMQGSPPALCQGLGKARSAPCVHPLVETASNNGGTPDACRKYLRPLRTDKIPDGRTACSGF